MRYVFIVLSLLVASALNAATPAGFRYDKVSAGGMTYEVADLDLHQADLKLYWKNAEGKAYESLTALRTALKSDGKTFLMATNSGIYATDYTPLGLHVERGKELHRLNRSHASTGNFFKVPNGVFFLTEKGPQILETSEYANLKKPVLEAAQSGPLLLRKGKPHPSFIENSPNKNLRSGVGINSEGHVIFVVSQGVIGFYDFALFFRDTLHCQDALYLDGTISSMLVTDHSAPVQFVSYTGIWAATQK